VAAWLSGSAASEVLQRLESFDDSDQVQPDRFIHLDQPLAAVGLRVGDELPGPIELITMRRQEVGSASPDDLEAVKQLVADLAQ
jgi:hypothetical protein